MAGVVPVELVADGLQDTHGSQRWRSHRCRRAAIDTFPLLVLSGRVYGIQVIERRVNRRHGTFVWEAGTLQRCWAIRSFALRQLTHLAAERLSSSRSPLVS